MRNIKTINHCQSTQVRVIRTSKNQKGPNVSVKTILCLDVTPCFHPQLRLKLGACTIFALHQFVETPRACAKCILSGNISQDLVLVGCFTSPCIESALQSLWNGQQNLLKLLHTFLVVGLEVCSCLYFFLCPFTSVPVLQEALLQEQGTFWIYLVLLAYWMRFTGVSELSPQTFCLFHSCWKTWHIKGGIQMLWIPSHSWSVSLFDADGIDNMEVRFMLVSL